MSDQDTDLTIPEEGISKKQILNLAVLCIGTSFRMKQNSPLQPSHLKS